MTGNDQQPDGTFGPSNHNVNHELGVKIPGNHLGRDRGRTKSQLLANIRFNPRRQVRPCSHGPGKLSHGRAISRPVQAFQGSAKFIVHERQLEAEGSRLGVDAVTSSDHRSELISAGLGRDDLSQ
jgi:hypothetical protein